MHFSVANEGLHQAVLAMHSSAVSFTSSYSLAEHFESIEKQVFGSIMNTLDQNVTKLDPGTCDGIFGIYTHQYLEPCEHLGVSSRAAWFAREHLVPAVLEWERMRAMHIHKGALFYDTGIAHLLAGDEDGYEYFLAMTDEEEALKAGEMSARGNMNLRIAGLATHTVTRRMQFACDLLNGTIVRYAADINFTTGATPVTAPTFDLWRQRLEPLHQFELLRIIHDLEVFLGKHYPSYPRSDDNPFVLLRLAKVLSHLAQWVESCLTRWQGLTTHKTLSNKLKADPDFGTALSNCAGDPKRFAGNNPTGTAVDVELTQLLASLLTAPPYAERQWRVLRVLSIVRNSTAHAIDPNLAIYRDRALLLKLIQTVFVSVFVISHLKVRPMP
jgi:hypothetical protein